MGVQFSDGVLSLARLRLWVQFETWQQISKISMCLSGCMGCAHGSLAMHVQLCVWRPEDSVLLFHFSRRPNMYFTFELTK